MTGIRIDRCFCFARTFASLRDVAEATGARSVGDLQRHVRFGAQCGLCRPYVRRMLRTGEVVFGEIVTEEDEPPGQPGPEVGDSQHEAA